MIIYHFKIYWALFVLYIKIKLGVDISGNVDIFIK